MAKPSVIEQMGKAFILKLIKENQPISIHALYKKSGYGSYSGVYDCIKRLKEKGFIIIEETKVDKIVKMVSLKENLKRLMK